MKQKTSRILVFVINTIIIILNSVISFVQQNTEKEELAIWQKTPIAIEQVFQGV